MTEILFHVGTYEEKGGRGLVPIERSSGGHLLAGDAFAEAANASFGLRMGQLAYLVDERDEGALTILRRDQGAWRKLAAVATGGDAPCYVGIDPQGQRVAVANYDSGSLSLFALDDAGLPCAPAEIFVNSGDGPHAERQERPHAHCTVFAPDGEALYLVDLGTDAVLRFDLVEGFRLGAPEEVWRAPAGSGPRHLLFHPKAPLALLLCELSSTLTLLELTSAGMRSIEVASTLPDRYSGENLGAHLAMNQAGDRIYVSNRGHDSLAVFTLDADEKRISLVQRVPSGGAHPRHFVLFEESGFVAVAHEEDGQVNLLDFAADGALGDIQQRLVVPGACFILR